MDSPANWLYTDLKQHLRCVDQRFQNRIWYEEYSGNCDIPSWSPVCPWALAAQAPLGPLASPPWIPRSHPRWHVDWSYAVSDRLQSELPGRGAGPHPPRAATRSWRAAVMAVLAKRPYGIRFAASSFSVGPGRAVTGDRPAAIGPFLPLRPLRPLDTSSCLRTVQNVYAFLRLWPNSFDLFLQCVCNDCSCRGQ